MFENFVIFTEVVKLSTLTYYQLCSVNLSGYIFIFASEKNIKFDNMLIEIIDLLIMMNEKVESIPDRFYELYQKAWNITWVGQIVSSLIKSDKFKMLVRTIVNQRIKSFQEN